MFKSIGTTLITGFITLLPVVLTIYLLYWMVVSSEEVMGAALRLVLPEVAYYPGMGTVAGVVIVFFVGLLMKAVLVRQLFAFGENIPSAICSISFRPRRTVSGAWSSSRSRTWKSSVLSPRRIQGVCPKRFATATACWCTCL
jgi:uncharacterized membrane protein